MNYWMVKQEPSSYSFDDFSNDGATDWSGVRNYQARNNLMAMKKGDKVLFYHSGDEKAVVGHATVSKPQFPDPTDEAWVAVVLSAGKKFKKPVPLSAIKANLALKEIALVKNSRLSVLPLTKDEYDEVVSMAR